MPPILPRPLDVVTWDQKARGGEREALPTPVAREYVVSPRIEETGVRHDP